MAKENKTKFPSDANKPIVKAGSKPLPTPAKKAPEQKVVTGVKQDLIKVHYKKKNHHVLNHVHSLRNGDNHIPRSVLNEALQHPSTIKLLNDKDLIIPADYYKDSEAPVMPDSEDDNSDDASDTTQGDDDTTEETTQNSEGSDIEKSKS
jgi:hypothetical protein